MKGALVINGYYTSKSYSYQQERILQEFEKRGAPLSVYKNDKGFIIGQTFDFDFAVFLDKDAELARAMEESGVIVFNSSFAIAACDNKITQLRILHGKENCYFPKTIAAPLRYDNDIDLEFLRHVENELGLPVVIKTAYGSLGVGVYKAENFDELTGIAKKLASVPHLYQMFVSESAGKSVRAVVIGDKIVASYALINDKDFRSNAERGGKPELVTLDDTYTLSALAVAKVLDTDICAVDFLYGAALLLEVNGNPFFAQAEKVSGVNIAGEYAEYVLKYMNEMRE